MAEVDLKKKKKLIWKSSSSLIEYSRRRGNMRIVAVTYIVEWVQKSKVPHSVQICSKVIFVVERI